MATDIAARGIDVSGVSHVFNFEIPNVPEQYVHRIGRTARAGADGVALSFVAPDEKPYLRDIEKLTGVKLMPQSLPEDFQKEAARLPLPSRKPAEAAQDARRDERDARGRGGQGRANGHGRPSGGKPSSGRGNQPRGGVGRDGQTRDQNLRNDRIYNDRTGNDRTAARGPVHNPLREEERISRPQGEGDRRPARHDGDRRPARAEGDRRPTRPEGERRGPRPQGEAGGERKHFGRGGNRGGGGGQRSNRAG